MKYLDIVKYDYEYVSDPFHRRNRIAFHVGRIIGGGHPGRESAEDVSRT